MINALCIDLEPWYAAELVKKWLPANRWDKDDKVAESVSLVLSLLDKHNVKATFAVLGSVAERYPGIVRSIFEKGHEIASHAYSHMRLHDLGKEKFEDEIRESVTLLESITGERPIGFRAPSFSIDNSTKWAFDVLKKYGFKYDASIFPVKTMLYGVPNAPLYPYKPSANDVSREDPDGNIVEFPMTVFRLCRINVPVAGGFYFRFLPLSFIKLAVGNINKTRPAIMYVHPWELYPGTPKPKGMPLLSRFVTYYGINSAFEKFENLLERFRFQPLKEFLNMPFGEVNH